MLTIKRATLEDAVYIALLGRITYTESHGNYVEKKEDLLLFYREYYSVAKVKNELSDKENLFWIVFYDELPIGFAKLVLNVAYQELTKATSCRLHRLYLLNDFMGLKIGSQLLEIIIKTVSDLNFSNIWLSAYYKNINAIRFYHKYGFKKIGTIDFLVGKTPYENIVFARKITK